MSTVTVAWGCPSPRAPGPTAGQSQCITVTLAAPESYGTVMPVTVPAGGPAVSLGNSNNCSSLVTVTSSV